MKVAPQEQGRDRFCGNCKFWRRDVDAPETGECRADPPTVLYDAEDGAFSLWPCSEQTDWCGRHSPTKQ